MANRKKRSDRNHIIYKITNNVTNETYIGVTVSQHRYNWGKSVHSRWLRHLYKAIKCMADFPISESIRTYGEHAFTQEVIEIVRGKKPAFQREAELINEYRPELNQRMQH